MNRYKEEFGEVYKSNYRNLFFCALDIVNDEEWAKDIVGDVFSRAWSDYERLRTTDLKAYLFISVRNRSIDHARRERAKLGYHKIFLEIEREWHSAHENEYEEEIQRMHHAINEMPERQQTIFRRCFLDGKRYREVADEMQLKESSVHKYMVKSFAFLRERLKKSIL